MIHNLIVFNIFNCYNFNLKKATDDNSMNDSLIFEEIKSNFPYLTISYDKCPVSILNSKLALNNALKELGSEIVSWGVERLDKEINYCRVSHCRHAETICALPYGPAAVAPERR